MRRDDEFQPKVGKPRVRPPRQRFVRLVMKAAEKHAAGGLRRIGKIGMGRRRGGSSGARRMYRGGAAALRLKQSRVPRGQRRVVVKARIVRHGPTRSTLLAHLKYLKRDGVTRDGARGRLFDAVSDDVDEGAFAARAERDRHHFRFMVSPEDGDLLTDLKAYTRDLMAQMEADLGTTLEWAALDHYNTDKPHIHVTIRGIAADGRDLIIDRDYITFGLRARAQDLATLELGLQTELEIRAKQHAEIGQERLTSLDRALLREAEDGAIDLRPGRDDPLASPSRSVLLGRLSTLRRLGLAEEIDPGRWRLAPNLEPDLRALGERGDIIKAMTRALSARGVERTATEYAIHDGERSAPVIGRIIGKGFADELADRMHLIVDGIDGRAHYIEVGDLDSIAGIPTGAIVEIRRESVTARASDRAIARLAGESDAIYRPSRHLAQARETVRVPNDDHEGYVEAHVRRLEALRRAGIVRRLDADRWQVPENLVERGANYDAQRRGRGITINPLSLIDLDNQVSAPGATWLDRQLVGRNKAELGRTGFAEEVRAALDRRGEYLVIEGLAQHRSNRIVFARDLLATLESRELEQAACTIAADTELSYRHMGDGERVRGIYRRAVDLSSGRYALVENAREFTLVPWRSILEQEVGREVSGIMRGRGVSWSFGRERDLSL
jgi:type IV secretory pathway VirD2 relaxase